MSEYDEYQVGKALDTLNLEVLYRNGGETALLVDGEPVKVTLMDRADESPYQMLDEVYGYDVWMVVQIGDQFFKKFGYWTSHEGRSWQGYKCVEVFPKTKTVEYYE